LTPEVLCHLSEVELRGVYLRHAYASMHAYCVAELHMSDSEAYFRIRVARLSRRFPVVLEMLAKGEIHLSALQVARSGDDAGKRRAVAGELALCDQARRPTPGVQGRSKTRCAGPPFPGRIEPSRPSTDS
jgi:hypothetical protein